MNSQYYDHVSSLHSYLFHVSPCHRLATIVTGYTQLLFIMILELQVKKTLARDERE